MTIWVRLIGGEHNGTVQKVDDDQVEIVARRRVPVTFATLRGSMNAMATESKSTRYTRREVAADDGRLIFFADEKLSDLEALTHALGP